MTRTLETNEAQLVLREVKYPDRMRQIGRFRVKAWRDEEGVDPDFFSQEMWLDEVDRHARHWIVTAGFRIVAAARLSLHDSLAEVPYEGQLADDHKVLFGHQSIASINRLVVDPAFRGRGLAGRLDDVRIRAAEAMGARVMIAFPQKSRIGSLRKRGFEMVAELDSIAEMPERPFYVMKRDLSVPAPLPGFSTERLTTL